MDKIVLLFAGLAAVVLGAVGSYMVAKRIPYHQSGWLTAAEIVGPLIF